MEALTLTTDFGHRDWYVAAMKGVVLSRVPAATLVDLCHEVPPGDVETAAFFLEAAAPTFPPDTVHLAVVDPGVGTERRILVVETEGGVFVGPDNGVFHPFLDDARRVVAAERPDLHRPAPGATFHGRDRFAPLAAALLGGETAADLGGEIDDPVRLDLPPPERHTDEGSDGGGVVLRGRVRHVDHFGNLVTDLPAEWLSSAVSSGVSVEVAVDGHRTDLWVRTYAEIPPGRAAVLVGSLGTLELSLDGASLAEAWGVERGATVEARYEGG